MIEIRMAKKKRFLYGDDAFRKNIPLFFSTQRYLYCEIGEETNKQTKNIYNEQLLR